MDVRPRRTRWTALAFVLAAALTLVGPAASLAAPTTTTIDAKKVEKAAAEAEVARMRTELQTELRQYVGIGKRIQLTRTEIAKVTSETAALDVALGQSRDTLRVRAVEIYRGDRMGMFAVLLGARSPRDFLLRLDYLLRVSEQDASLVDETTRLYSQSLYLQSVLGDRLKHLVELQSAADDQRGLIEKGIADGQAKAKQLGTDVAQLLSEQAAAAVLQQGQSPTSVFDPNTVISEANFRAVGSMDATAIQTFLDGLPGTLKSYRAPDHNGRTVTAAQMIAEASAAWGISPKVILVTLQKEQSLLEKTNPTQQAYDWAMGCGKGDSYTAYQYQGFGKQIWWGAQKFKANADLWKPGATQDIDGSIVYPTNPGTHAQYRYTPHFSGVTSFWMLYWRYFGDPLR